MTEVSRQRKWQLKMLENGRCQICGEELETKQYCERHTEIHRKRGRERYRKKAGIPLDAAKYTRANQEKKG